MKNWIKRISDEEIESILAQADAWKKVPEALDVRTKQRIAGYAKRSAKPKAAFSPRLVFAMICALSVTGFSIFALPEIFRSIFEGKQLPASITSLSNGVLIVRQNGETVSAGNVRIERGDRILTGTDSTCTVGIGDASVVRIESGADVLFDRMDSKATEIDLASGKIDCAVEPLSGDSRFAVYSGGVTVSVEGTRFSMKRTPDNSVEVSVDEGAVNAEYPSGGNASKHAIGAGKTFVVTDEEIASGKTTVHALAFASDTLPEGDAWRWAVERFEKDNPGIDIRYEIVDRESYALRTEQRLSSGEIPDIAYMGDDSVYGSVWRKYDEQYDIGPLLDPGFFDLNLMRPIRPASETYFIPLGMAQACSLLYMNETLVRSLGLSTPRTYEDLVAMVPVARKKGLAVVSLNGEDAWAWNSCVLSSVLARLSGDPYWVSNAIEGKHRFDEKVFIDSLRMAERMVRDGVIEENAFNVNYGMNIKAYNLGNALFMIQGQWALGNIDRGIIEHTVLLSLPILPGEKPGAEGSVAAATFPGYGLTRTGASRPEVREAAMKFLRQYYGPSETGRRLANGSIMAPIIRNYSMSRDLFAYGQRKMLSSRFKTYTEVIDQRLPVRVNEVFNKGLMDIIAGKSTPEKVAASLENAVR